MDTMHIGSRITYKRKRPNPLFQEWLEELHEEAKAKKSKLEHILNEARTSLSRYPLSLKSGADCAILKGFDKKLCTFLDKRLEVYRFNNQINQTPTTSSQTDSNDENNLQCPTNTFETKKHQSPISKTLNSNLISKEENHSINSESDSQKNVIEVDSDVEVESQLKRPSRLRGSKSYKPAYKSGSYAILVALLEHVRNNPSKLSLTKDELIEKAQIHSEESFTRPKPGSFYTAWTNMSKLITKGLVIKERIKKVEYSLTETGVLLAEKILEEYSNVVSTNDIIFRGSSISVTAGNVRVGVFGPTDTAINDVDFKSDNSVENNEGLISTAQMDDEFVEMLPGTFDIILLIDKNETSGCSKKNDPTVVQFKKFPDLKHEYRNLKIGDFTWIAKHKTNNVELVLPYVIERKRKDDLAASIKDGRFHEQKFRLRKCGMKHVIYMMEKYDCKKHVGLPMQSLMQALANTRVQDSFKVHMTNSLNNSVRFLAMMTKRLTLEYKDKHLKGVKREPSDDELMTYEYFNKSSIKNRPLTVTETFIKILLQLKGVSTTKALAITNKYPTPSSLIRTYMRGSHEEGEKLLANLKYGNLDRNVGPVVSKSIYQLFANKDLS